MKAAAVELRQKTVARRMKNQRENEQRIRDTEPDAVTALPAPRSPHHVDGVEGGGNWCATI